MEKIEANCSFANKLWNICKFVTGNALKDVPESELSEIAVLGPISQEEFDAFDLPEQFIVSKCHELVAGITSDIERYQLGAAGSKVSVFCMPQQVDLIHTYVLSLTRSTNSFGMNTQIGTSKYRRHGSMKEPGEAESRSQSRLGVC